MKPLKALFRVGSLLAIALTSNQAFAKPIFVTYQPADYNNAITCTSCHSSPAASEGNVVMSYGIAFNATGADDDFVGSIEPAYRSLEAIDSDGDGFSNIQEIKGYSSFNSAFSTPVLFGAGTVNAGSVAAEPAVNETVADLSSVATTPAAVTALLTPGQKNLGGTVEYTMTNLTADAYGNTGTTTFMFKTGGVQIGANAYFVDGYGNATLIPTTADAYGNVASIALIPAVAGSAASSKGSITVTIADDGPFDLYSQAGYIAEAKARTPSFTSTAIFDAYANVSPYANISPDAIIDPYAIIDAYAIVDAFATIGANAKVSSYAYVGPNVDVYTNVTIDPYVAVDSTISPVTTTVTMPTQQQFASAVQSRIAIATTQPVARVYSAGGVNDGVSGGLHCMTGGLGTYGLMLLGLLATSLLVRRKQQ